MYRVPKYLLSPVYTLCELIKNWTRYLRGKLWLSKMTELDNYLTELESYVTVLESDMTGLASSRNLIGKSCDRIGK